MPSAPRPLNDSDRVDALRSSGILDSSPDDYLNDAVMSLVAYYQVPIALVSLVDSERQWFKARWGLDVDETPREWAFCGYTILSQQPLIVPDATKDDRFRENPLVTGAPHIRYYAGAPIRLNGEYPAGTVCLIDSKPHSADVDLSELQRTAALVEHYIDNHYTAKQKVLRDTAPGVLPRVEVVGSSARIIVSGDLRVHAARSWLKRVSANAELASCTDITVDLAGCAFVDSSGVGALVKLFKTTVAQNRKFRLCNLQPPVALLFDRLRLSQVIPIE